MNIYVNNHSVTLFWDITSYGSCLQTLSDTWGSLKSSHLHCLPFLKEHCIPYSRLTAKPHFSLQPSLPSLQLTSPTQTFSNSHICLNPSRASCLHLFSSSLPPGTVSICTPLSSTLLLPLPLPLCWRSFMSEPIAMVTGNLLYVSSPGAVNEGVLTAFE